MSISSMLGGETPKLQEAAASAPTNGLMTNYVFPPSTPHTSASSPTKPDSANNSRYRRSPEIQGTMSNSINRFRAYSGGAAQPMRSSIESASAMHPRFGRSSGESISQISPRSDNGATQDWRGRNDRHSDPGRSLERPSSQPSGPRTSIEEINRRNMDINARQRDFGPLGSMRDGVALNPERNDPTVTDQLSHHSHLNSKSTQPEASNVGAQHTPPDDRMHLSRYPFLSSRSVFSEPMGNEVRTETYTPRSMEQKQMSAQKGPWDAEALRRIRDERLGTTSLQQQRTPANLSGPRSLDVLNDQQQQAESKYPSTFTEMERSDSLDRAIQQTRIGEDGHRNSLALMLDHNRRAGRASPMPQAVQGAQGKTNGPSRDPSIKNEFSKMFAGIGSGVSSSGLAGSGASTPFPPSPKQGESEQRLPFGNRNDLIEITKSRNGSRMGNKRNRKIKDKDKAEDSKGVDGLFKIDAGKGTKRMRHHHHAPGHQ